MKQLIVKYWKKMSVEDALFIFSMFGFSLLTFGFMGGYGSRFAEDPNSVFNSYMPKDAGDYFGVYVYNKNDELVMTYYVHPNLWDAYSVTVDGEIKMLCSNDAVG